MLGRLDRGVHLGSAEPAEISAIGCSSIGEMSVNVVSDATRSPPIQCRVSTVYTLDGRRRHPRPCLSLDGPSLDSG